MYHVCLASTTIYRPLTNIHHKIPVSLDQKTNFTMSCVLLCYFSATQLANLNEKFQQILTEAVNEQNDDHNLTDAAKIKEKKATDE